MNFRYKLGAIYRNKYFGQKSWIFSFQDVNWGFDFYSVQVASVLPEGGYDKSNVLSRKSKIIYSRKQKHLMKKTISNPQIKWQLY